MRAQEFLDELKINNQSGIGAVPFNQEVDYFGLRVAMRPSKFLQLSLPLNPDDPEEQKIIQWVADRLDDPGIGAPFLDVQIPPQWEDGDFDKPAKITGHDGRHRMYAIHQKHGDSPVEVHMIPRGGLRRRDLSDQWIQQLQAGVRGQTGQYVRNIFVSAA
jgi:hypothetical protein